MPETPLVPLRDISTHIKDGTHGTHKRVESGVPLLSAKNVEKNGRLQWDKSDDLISEADYAVLNAQFTPKANDLLLTVVGSIGRSALFDGARVAFQRSVAFVRCTKAVVPAYLYQATCSPNFVRQLERRCNVTAQAGLYLGELAKITIPLPSRERQEKIARVLASIDTAIARTEALIAKYQQIKAGLMHDLFTRGVLPNGQLRPPRSEAPELYQETVLGWIPADWQIEPLSCNAKIVSGVTLGTKEAPVNAVSVPYLRVANVQDGYLDLQDLKTLVVSAQTVDQLRLLPGDVLMNEGGDFDKLGRGTVWSGEIENCIHQNHVFRVRCDKTQLLPEFLAFFTESDFGKRYFRVNSKQSTNLASINSTQLHAYPVALPHPQEQERIVHRIHKAVQAITALQADVEKLRLGKIGRAHV